MLVMVTNLSRNVQVSCSLLELFRRHVVMLQVKVLQVAYMRQLTDDVAESFTVWIFAQNRDLFWSFTRVSWLAPGWQMDLAWLEVLFFSVTVQELCVVRQISASFSPNFLLMQVAPKADHLRHQKQQSSLGERGLSSSSSSSSRVWVGYADFCFERVKITRLLGWADRSRDFVDRTHVTRDFSKAQDSGLCRVKK